MHSKVENVRGLSTTSKKKQVLQESFLASTVYLGTLPVALFSSSSSSSSSFLWAHLHLHSHQEREREEKTEKRSFFRHSVSSTDLSREAFNFSAWSIDSNVKDVELRRRKKMAFFLSSSFLFSAEDEVVESPELILLLIKRAPTVILQNLYTFLSALFFC